MSEVFGPDEVREQETCARSEPVVASKILVVDNKEYALKRGSRLSRILLQCKEDVGDYYRNHTHEYLASQVFGHCESEIERIMAACLYSEIATRGYMAPFVPCKATGIGQEGNHSLEEWTRWKCVRTNNQCGIFVFMQAPVGPYRADFMIASLASPTGRIRWLVVECDGHEFHKATKEQAARDAARDRYMAAADITVMRFTGSEVFASPQKQAAEAISFLLSRMDEEKLEGRS